MAQKKQAPPCATMDIHNEKMANDSGYRKDMDLVERQIQAQLAKEDSLKRKSQELIKNRKRKNTDKVK